MTCLGLEPSTLTCGLRSVLGLPSLPDDLSILGPLGLSAIPGVLGDHPQSPTTTFYRHPPLKLTPFNMHGPPSALRTDQRQSAHGSCLLVLALGARSHLPSGYIVSLL